MVHGYQVRNGIICNVPVENVVLHEVWMLELYINHLWKDCRLEITSLRIQWFLVICFKGWFSCVLLIWEIVLVSQCVLKIEL